MSKKQLEKSLSLSKKNMEKAVKELDFTQAAKYRDEIIEIQNLIGEKK